MSHEVEEMMYVGDAPWHGLGKRFIEAPTLDEAIPAAGLDWTVTTEPLYTATNEVVNAQATRRSSDGSLLGVVGPTYKPLQNREAFEFFRPFIDQGQAQIETAGSLRDGKKVFILAKINRDPMVIKGNDTVEKYVLLSNSHDGTLAVKAGFTPIRVVCANTLSLAHSKNTSKLLRIKHTKNVVENLSAVQEVMNLANAEFEATAEQYRYLANKDINTKDLEQFVRLVFTPDQRLRKIEQGISTMREQKVMQEILPLFEQGRGNNMQGVKGTYWAAYNAVTEYLQYKRGGNETVRLDSLWFGAGKDLNKRALDVATQLAGKRVA